MCSNVWLRSAALMMIGLMAAFLGACGGGGDGIPQTMTLSANAVTPSEVQLNWTPHPDPVTGYDIVRNGEAAYPYHVSGTSYTDRELEPLTRYCYVIYAVVWPLGTVGQSNQVCIITPGTAGWTIETIGVGGSPALALDSSNQPRVSYRNSSGVILTYKSAGSWLQSLVDGGAGANGDTDVVVDQFSADRLSYADDANDRLMHASNTTGVWATETADTAVGWVNALSIDDSGNAHMVYNSDEAYTGVVSYVTNASGSWQKERLVGFSSASIRDADILVDTAGVVHVAFTVRGIECYVYYMNNQGGAWQEQIVDGEGNCGAAMAIDSAGNVHIAYSRKFALMHTHNTGGSWQSEQLDSFSWIGGDRVGLAIDAADHLHIAYQDQNADLKYATNVSGIWERYFLDSRGDVGGDPSITVDPVGQVSIVYTDQTNGSVKLVTSP